MKNLYLSVSRTQKTEAVNKGFFDVANVGVFMTAIFIPPVIYGHVK